jgi:hypothetical protein
MASFSHVFNACKKGDVKKFDDLKLKKMYNVLWIKRTRPSFGLSYTLTLKECGPVYANAYVLFQFHVNFVSGGAPFLL